MQGAGTHTHSVVMSTAATWSERKPTLVLAPAWPTRLLHCVGRCLGPTAPHVPSTVGAG